MPRRGREKRRTLLFHLEAIDRGGSFLEEVEGGRIGVGIRCDEVGALGGVRGRICGVLTLVEAGVGHIFGRGTFDEVGVGASGEEGGFHHVGVGCDVIEGEEAKEVVFIEWVGAGKPFVIVGDAVAIPICIGVVGGVVVAIFGGVFEEFVDVVVWDAVGIGARCGEEVES